MCEDHPRNDDSMHGDKSCPPGQVAIRKLFPHKEKVELHTDRSQRYLDMSGKRKLLANGIWPVQWTKTCEVGRSQHTGDAKT